MAGAAKTDLDVALCRDEQGLNWFHGDNYQLYCVTDFRELQKVCAGQAGSGRCPSIPVYFHGTSLEISEISDKLVQVRSSTPWSSESAHTT